MNRSNSQTAKELRQKLRNARAAFTAIKRDLIHCDWRCERCGADPQMLQTDINIFVNDGLKATK